MTNPLVPKAEAVARRAEYRAKRKMQRGAQLRCFWTRPWGHVWKYDGNKGLAWFYRCASCGKTRVDIQ